MKPFLFTAKGSRGESRSMLLLAIELRKTEKTALEKLLILAEEISKILSGLTKKLLITKL